MDNGSPISCIISLSTDTYYCMGFSGSKERISCELFLSLYCFPHDFPAIGISNRIPTPTSFHLQYAYLRYLLSSVVDVDDGVCV